MNSVLSFIALASVVVAQQQQPKGPGTINLGTAGNFVILAKSGGKSHSSKASESFSYSYDSRLVSNVPTSQVVGDIGVSPSK